MQIFLNELNLCEQRGDKMKAIIIENQSLTIIQNSSFHSLSNLTESVTEFTIVLKDIIISNNQCNGIVLDAKLNYINVNILLLCYENNQTIGWNNLGKKFWQKIMILLILTVAFNCFIITVVKGIQWLYGKKKSVNYNKFISDLIYRFIRSIFQICNIHNERMLLISPNNGK
ncbi:hypothetical protein LOAG_11753 [Loa loa]|uniref:Transmembrane protein n=1 Tax=Loa loa TaxID=7209 RepID=A0A1S0TMF9_LOALO|nr:hypothetical protein LOAG_11753 [Loa loa]EFO16750.1 hypothetical protein LOAG_11753 [Loa loa]